VSFHVPERSRVTRHALLASTADDGNNGAFMIVSPEPGWSLVVICSDDEGWEHVSVHAFRGEKLRTPNWREMCAVKDLFWDGEDEVVQYHPKRSEYVNLHQHTLHLWRPIGVEFPRPDAALVGPNGKA
jgi:hypothetical protein